LPCGHAYSKQYLSSIFPIPQEPFKAGADYIVFALVPLFGKLKRIQEPQAHYRIHGNNDTLKSLDVYIERFLGWFDSSCSVLEDILVDKGLEVDRSNWRRDSWYHRIHDALIEIDNHVPAGASYILADDNHWMANDRIHNRRKISFTEVNGQYWGPPADDAMAIEEIERHSRNGATFMVFAWPAFWWLDYYSEMHRYLKSNYRCVSKGERSIVFSLQRYAGLNEPIV
jgi:hypothetical protein